MENLTKIPIKYTGPISMNARSINNAIYTINGINNKKESLNEKKIGINELMNILNFLENNIMSNSIYFDGTVPNYLNEQVLVNVHSIKKLSINEIKPILVKNKKKLSNICKVAAEQSSELIKHIDVNSLLENKIDNPVDDFKKFELDIMNAAMSENAKNQICGQIFDSILNSEETYTGSKCVAGIILSEIEGKSLLEIVAEYFNLCKDDSQKSYLVGALVNRFRTNYINKLSSQDDYEAAYQIDPSLENLQSQQTFLLWKYVLKRIEREYNTEQANAIRHLFAGEHHTFPIGFAAILHPKTKNIETLFENSMKLHDKYFVKLLANNTEQHRFLHQFEVTDFQDFQEELMSEAFIDLKTSKSKACEFIITHAPEVIGIASGAAMGAFIEDNSFIFDMASQVAGGILVREVAKKGLEMVLPNKKYNVFINNLEKLSSFYKNAFETDDNLSARLVSQTEKIFGRQLEMQFK